MASSEVQRIWDDAVASFEAATGTKLDSLPTVASADDLADALQIQETKFEAFRHSKSRVDKIRSTLKQSLHFVDQTGKILASTFSSVSLIDLEDTRHINLLTLVELRSDFWYFCCCRLTCAGN